MIPNYVHFFISRLIKAEDKAMTTGESAVFEKESSQKKPLADFDDFAKKGEDKVTTYLQGLHNPKNPKSNFTIATQLNSPDPF